MTIRIRLDVVSPHLPREISEGIFFWQSQWSALGKWGRTQMGSHGLSRILTGFYLFDPAGVRLAPLKTRDFKGFPPDFNRVLSADCKRGWKKVPAKIVEKCRKLFDTF